MQASRRRITRWLGSEEEALEVVKQVEDGIAYRNSSTLSSVIDQYEQHLAEAETIGHGETIRRLRLFFTSPERRISRISADEAETLYEAFRARKRPDGKPISVSYHRSTLINARSMFKWARKRGMIATNPFVDVEGVGRRSRGKEQWTGDEAKRFYRFALSRAKDGDKNALACLMLLLMGLRSSDVCRRVVRDVDMGGSVLRVSEGKTKKSDRPRHVPGALRSMLAKLAKGRDPFEPLFKTPYRADGHHTRRWLEQALDKLCTAAKVPRVVPHSLKGVSGSILAETGELADRIADHLSHEDTATTRKHYVRDGALEAARRNKGLAAICGAYSGTRKHPKRKRR